MKHGLASVGRQKRPFFCRLLFAPSPHAYCRRCDHGCHALSSVRRDSGVEVCRGLGFAVWEFLWNRGCSRKNWVWGSRTNIESILAGLSQAACIGWLLGFPLAPKTGNCLSSCHACHHPTRHKKTSNIMSFDALSTKL